MSLWDKVVRYFERRPYDGGPRRASAPAPKPAAPARKEIERKGGQDAISRTRFETMVAAYAGVLAAGEPISAMHYLLARNQLKRDLAAKGVTVMDGERSEAAREAGGADKL